MKNHLIKILGIILICIGIIGLFLPLIQGIALIFIGLILIFGREAVMKFFRRS